MMELATKVKCKYCDKEFRKESTLAVHTCERKRRWAQEKETGVQIGFQTYLKFFEMSQGSAKNKTYEHFVDSQYYSAFVKFGQFIVQIRAVNVPRFIEWTIKQERKLDWWTKDEYYDEYLFEYMKKEHPQDALERSLTEMQRYADENNMSLSDVFKKGGKGDLCLMIQNGRISPWVLYSCDSGIEFLGTLNEEQVTKIFKWISPDFWQRKLKDYMADAELIKEALALAQL